MTEDQKYSRDQFVLMFVGLAISTVNCFLIFFLLATIVTAPVLVGLKFAALFLCTAFFLIGAFLSIIGFGRAVDPY